MELVERQLTSGCLVPCAWLVPGGSPHLAEVWNPYVGKSIHTIHGHSAPIVGIEVLGASSNQAGPRAQGPGNFFVCVCVFRLAIDMLIYKLGIQWPIEFVI